MRRGPGLLRPTTRTAVVAGTATAVVDGVHLRRVRCAAEATSIEDSRISQLELLARLRAQGVLTKAEFDREKATILGPHSRSAPGGMTEEARR
jgi:hypothetical protein